MRHTRLERWLEDLRLGWTHRDPGAIAALFSESATYRHHPHKAPLVGRAEIRDYWETELRGVVSVEVTWDAPIGDGERLAVEYQAKVEGTPSMLDHGVLILRFDADECTELREYWMIDETTL